jgi:DNA-binding MarR family transcriptional regulator
MSVTTRRNGAHGGESGAVGDLQARLAATIPLLMRHLSALARRSPAWRKFTFQQYNVLRIIHEQGPVGQTEIGRQLMVSAPVVTRLVGGLAELRLVERTKDPADRRAVRLVLTAAGRRKSAAMRRSLLAAATELVESLPTERRATVADALDELQVLLPSRPTAR